MDYEFKHSVLFDFLLFLCLCLLSYDDYFYNHKNQRDYINKNPYNADEHIYLDGCDYESLLSKGKISSFVQCPKALAQSTVRWSDLPKNELR